MPPTPPALSRGQAARLFPTKADVAAKYAPLGGSIRAAFMGDSLLVNGFVSGQSSTGQAVGTLGAPVAVGATSLSFVYPYTSGAGFANVTPPGALATVYVIEPDTDREEYIVATATGSGPYTLATPALQYAHAAGAEIRGYTRWFNSQSVPGWMLLLSKGAMQFGEMYAHGGYTTQQIHDIYLPQLLKAKSKPHVVFICAGTNDNYNVATAFPVLLTIIDKVKAAGITPIVMGVAPGGQNPTATNIALRTKWNLKLSVACSDRGVAYIDVFSALVDDGSGIAGSGSYKTRYNLDEIHPNDIGAKVWAQALWNGAAPLFPIRPDPLAPSINKMADATAYPYATNNAVLLDDANADGIPDLWAKSQGNAGDTVSLVTEAGVPGKMLSVTRVANGATDPIVKSQNCTVVSGARYRGFLRIKTSGVDAAFDAHASTTGTGGGLTTSSFLGFDIRLMAETGQLDLFALRGWKGDINELATIAVDFVVPAGLSLTTITWQLRLRGTSTTPAYTVKVQPFLANLTYLGA